MRSVNINQAKTNLSKLVDQVQQGEEIIIAKAGVPMAKLIALSPFNQIELRLGLLKGKIKIANDFDAPLANNLLGDFEK